MIDSTPCAQTRWRAIALIVATYFYFLIFAQFGFLHRITETLGADHWDLVLGMMAISGICGALFTAFEFESECGVRWLLVGFVGAAGGALLGMIGTHLFVFVLSALLTGFFLALLTTALVGVLSAYFPRQQIGLVCGWGTGLAYFFSNIPMVFEASALMHCAFGALSCVLGIVICCTCSWRQLESEITVPESEEKPVHARRIWIGQILLFLVLVWSDSAAFTQIQGTAELKALSWAGASHLWMIGGVHLIAAVGGGLLMDGGRASVLTVLAFLGLLLGFLGLQQFTVFWPTLVYAAAVSFYSTALVAFALVQRSRFSAVLRAGVVFAVAGWLGSTMGIGMVGDLGGVPVLFWVVASSVLVVGLYCARGRHTV